MNTPKTMLDLSRVSDKQIAFLTAEQKHVAFGGARGGGKSWAVRAKAVILAVSHPGIKILIVRRTFPELYNNHIMPLQDILRGAAVYNKTEKIFLFPGGSSIRFGYCNADRDLDQYQGAEYDVIFLDEATQLQEIWIRKITACVRGVGNFPRRIYYTCNPGGVGHGYIKRLFIDRRFEAGENPEDYVFIQALVTDNKALMEAQPDYVSQLQALPPRLRDAWLHGRWDLNEGQFFDDFRTSPDPERCEMAGISTEEARKQHRFVHVIEPFDIGSGECRGWSILRSYDFGYNKPFSVGWWAVDYDGVLYRILELYGCTGTPNEGVRWPPDRQFAEIARLEREHPWLRGRQITGIADPSIWDASRGESIAETAAKYGVWFSPGDNQRIPGWMQVHYRLQFDENGYARMYVFRGCEALIRTLPTMVFSKTNPEDLDTAMEDHCADEVRYLCMSRPVGPVVRKPAEQVGWNPLGG